MTAIDAATTRYQKTLEHRRLLRTLLAETEADLIEAQQAMEAAFRELKGDG